MDSKQDDKKNPENKDEKKEEEKEPELSEEDKKIKEELELMVERVSDPVIDIVKAAIVAMKKEIRTSTSSMTSVPKPLKFLRPHYDTLKAVFEKLEGPVKGMLADVLSWLGMTASPQTRDSLHYRLSGTDEEIGVWGHEYVRHLCMEVGDEFQERIEKGENVDDLTKLVFEIVPYFLSHNAEPDACDIMIEIEQIKKMDEFVDETNFRRVCLYLESCASYLPEPDDIETLKVTMRIYSKMNLVPETMKLALATGDTELIQSTWDSVEDPLMKKQLAYMLGQQGYFEFIPDTADDELVELLGNTKRSQYFGLLAADLDIKEPKLPEDIYKSHLAEKQAPAKADSARQNLARTFVNAFVNAGFGVDGVMTVGTGTNSESEWIFKNRDHGRISAAASLGMIHLWDNANGVNELEKYSALQEDFVRAGVLLGIGLCNANVRDPFDIPYSYAADTYPIGKQSNLVKQCTALGLGLAYAGTSKAANVKDLLLSVYETGPTLEVEAHLALGLGLIFVGTCDADLTDTFVQSLLERSTGDDLNNPYSRYLCLALGLLFLGKQEAAEVTLEALKVIPGPMGSYAALTVETCAYAASGNVLKIQKLLGVCGEHLEKDNSHQAVAVLGIALIACKESIGKQMVVRSFDHLLQYGDENIRRIVPLALGILSISKPDASITDTLSKFSHDHDSETAMGAIFGLGLIGAGTNNARIAGLLRGLASYYYKDPNALFVVRLAQALLHMGKGTISLTPFHNDGFLLRPAAMAGLLVTIHSCFDFKNLILGQAHYMLYSLVLAMFPKMLMTFNESGEPLNVLVRVGQAVDVVGKAGNPKNITGFQTHTTPVLLGVGDRAELATDEWIPVSPVLEGCVILKPNPESKKSLLASSKKLAASQKKL